MDLLANYADDGSSTPKTDSYDKVSESGMSQLEAEWASFEKMMGSDVMSGNQQDTVCKSQQLSPTDVKKSSSVAVAAGQSESSKDDDCDGQSMSGSSSEDSDDEKEEEKRPRTYSVSSASSAATSASEKSSLSKHSSESDKASEDAHSAHGDEDDLPMTVDKVGAKRSRSRSTSRSPSRKHRRSTDHRRSHSRDRHRHSRKDRRRRHSRSRSRDRHSRRHSSRDRHHRRHRRSSSRSHDSHHRRHGRHSSSRKHRHHSSDRKRSDKHRRRSHSPDSSRKNSGGDSAPATSGNGPRKTGPSVIYRTAGVKFHRETGSTKPLTFKEQMKQQILQSAKMMSENTAAGSSEDSSKPANPAERPNLNQHLNPANLFGNIATSTAGCGLMNAAAGTVTPQMAFLQTVAALHKQAQEITGVEVPKYYNPAAVNPLKYAEQVQKRKLLWSKAKDKKETNSQWNAQAVVMDGDSKAQAKFKKLMGIKDNTSTEAPASSADPKAVEQRQKQEELFQQLDREYEFARMTTHTQRGVGLGFGSQMYQHH